MMDELIELCQGRGMRLEHRIHDGIYLTGDRKCLEEAVELCNSGHEFEITQLKGK